MTKRVPRRNLVRYDRRIEQAPDLDGACHDLACGAKPDDRAWEGRDVVKKEEFPGSIGAS